MAFPVLIPVVAAGGAYVYGRFFSDEEAETTTGASVYKVALYSAAGVGLWYLYKRARG